LGFSCHKIHWGVKDAMPFNNKKKDCRRERGEKKTTARLHKLKLKPLGYAQARLKC